MPTTSSKGAHGEHGARGVPQHSLGRAPPQHIEKALMASGWHYDHAHPLVSRAAQDGFDNLAIDQLDGSERSSHRTGKNIGWIIADVNEPNRRWRNVEAVATICFWPTV